jgi:predicted RNase H-like HicB family nuclease
MKLRLLIELDPVIQRWSAVFPGLPGCASAGDTADKAIANVREALALWFEPVPLKLRKDAKLVELAMPRVGGFRSATPKRLSKFCVCMALSALASLAAIRNGGMAMADR